MNARRGSGQRCGKPAVYVDSWVRSDGRETARYYCAEHAHGGRAALRCVWSGCKGPVVAIIHDAPVCEEHAVIEKGRR